MRLLAFILTITVMFLAFKPGVDYLLSHCESEVSCCSESCAPFNAFDQKGSDEQKNDCNGNSCNPFQSCSSSFIVAENALSANDHHTLIDLASNFGYKSMWNSQFASEFWQPPQFA